MKTTRMAILLVAALVAGPCGDDREPMWIDLDIFSRHLRALDDDLRAHGHAVAGMTAAAPMTAAEHGFSRDARGHTGQMAAMLANMRSLCVHPDGSRPDLELLAGALGDLERAVTLHGSTMSMARTPEDARAEEGRFQDAAGDQVAALRSLTAGVAIGAAAYTCELHN